MKTKSDIRLLLVVIFALANSSCSHHKDEIINMGALSATSMPKYEIIDLGTVGATSTKVIINNTGQVIGDSGRHAFVWDSNSGLINIGTLGGFKSGAAAINNVGQIAGYAQIADGNKHAFLWDKKNGMIDLGVLSGNESYACAVNNSGQVVGSADINETVTIVPLKNAPDYKVTGFFNHAFIWDSNNGMIDIETRGDRMSVARAINNAGQVVGWFTDASGEIMHAFFWDSTNGMKDLGMLGDMIEYIGINDNGQVAATSWSTEKGKYLSFLWDSNGKIVHLDTLNGGIIHATSINNNGQVAGWASIRSIRGGKRACLWDSSGNITNLGYIGDSHSLLLGNDSMAFAVNDAGQVVGFCGREDTTYGRGHAFLWDKKYGMVKLEDLLVDKSGWKQLISADGINNSGQIVGFGETKDGKDHAFLMTPVLKEVKQKPRN